jgi:hypothetical protein
MSLRAIMVDRARVVRREKSGAKVEGSSAFGDVKSEWIRARLDVQSRDRTSSQAAGGRPATESAQLILPMRDLAGGLVDVTADDRVEVKSRELGEHTFVVDGDPLPLRKRRTMIGYTLRLRRVEAHRSHA